MEYEAIDEGTLAKIVVPEGTQDVPVNQLIAVLAEEGEDVKAAAAAAAKPVAAKPAAAAAKPASTAPSAPAPSAHSEVAPSPAPQARPASPPPSPERAEGKGEGIRTNGHDANRIFSSPLARRLAKEAGVDLARIQGSGPHGRIIARDVEAAKSGKGLLAPA